VAWILLCKRCKCGEKIYYNSRDIKFFQGSYFWRALYNSLSATPTSLLDTDPGPQSPQSSVELCLLNSFQRHFVDFLLLFYEKHVLLSYIYCFYITSASTHCSMCVCHMSLNDLLTYRQYVRSCCGTVYCRSPRLSRRWLSYVERFIYRRTLLFTFKQRLKMHSLRYSYPRLSC